MSQREAHEAIHAALQQLVDTDGEERYAADGFTRAPVAVLLHFDHCHVHGWIRAGRLCLACSNRMSRTAGMGRSADAVRVRVGLGSEPPRWWSIS
ncbi:hypothetical protein QIS99_28085 [Streptomyces sp. B-S-A8]|uniref:HNH endonuclease n=1 Tax=Streptomyces solicavernae TaxID=3043614 RepID=A0ABT6S028_9ACTN|nr:hypothetical protein [Streptomyces sp. B-S-A8]MDI3390022.1 hypothetical protein [Streptomyces sp. B-S-A8]